MLGILDQPKALISRLASIITNKRKPRSNYSQNMRNHVFPLSTSYVHKENQEEYMSFTHTASQTETSSNSVQLLLKGQVTEGIASSLGTTAASIQKFINGNISNGLESAIGINSSELQHLRNELDKGGAIGFILGLAIALPKGST